MLQDVNSFREGPDEHGRFGLFGGRFVAETLMPLILDLEQEYGRAKQDASFWAEMDDLWKHYVGRPAPLYFAERLTEHFGGAKIYLKRDELNHTGAHKINNVLGQILLARRMGKTRIIAETGAGQHGVATATVCARFGLECIVFMGATDVERQKPNVFRMNLLGAKVVPVTSGRATLKDAMNEALRDWVTNVENTFYCIGTVAGPHPYPAMVRDFQSIIGKEAKAQLMELEGRLPDSVVACIGGGSNAMGLFYPFLDAKEVRIIGVEAGGKGVDVVLDMVSGDYVPRNLQCLADDGRHVTIAVLGGAKAEIFIPMVMMRRLTLTGSTLRPRSDAFKAALADEIADNAWPLFTSGELSPVMDQTLPLTEAAAAHARRVVPFGLSMLGPVLQKFGSQAQQDHWLPRILDGTDWWCQGYSEPGAGSDLAPLKTRAVRDGGDFVLDGMKAFISGGDFSDFYVVMCRTGDGGPRGISAILVPSDAPGLSFGGQERKMGWKAQPTAQVQFDACRVPVRNLIGVEGDGFRYAMAGLDGGRLNIAACSLGGAQRALDKAVSYAKERKQFGVEIGRFQALQHRAAHLWSETEVTASAILHAGRQLDEAPQEATLAVSLAKARACKTVTLAVQEGVQMHGGIGMTDAYDMGFFMKRARVAAEWLGDYGYHAEIVARARGL